MLGVSGWSYTPAISRGPRDLDNVDEAVVCLHQEVRNVLSIDVALVQYSYKLTSENPAVFLKPSLPRRFCQILVEHLFELKDGASAARLTKTAASSSGITSFCTMKLNSSCLLGSENSARICSAFARSNGRSRGRNALTPCRKGYGIFQKTARVMTVALSRRVFARRPRI